MTYSYMQEALSSYTFRSKHELIYSYMQEALSSYTFRSKHELIVTCRRH